MIPVTLGSLLADHETRTRTLTVVAPEPLEELEEYFDAPGVEVTWEQVEGDGDGVVVVSEGQEVLGSVPVAALRNLVSPEDPPRPGTGVFDDWALRELFALLREATFSSSDRRQLLATSREFEDRAVRTGEGALHAGFQRPAALAAQAELYAAMAADTDLDVHAYLDAGWSVPTVPGVTVHAERDSELGDYWFVLFDGGPDAESACGLLAEQRDGTYYGFWTYDATTVNRLLAYLQDTY